METNTKLISEAENMVWQRPDSALAILNLADTSRLDIRQKAVYTLLHIQATDKTDGDITGRSEIFGLRKYFDHSGDAKHAALAAFYEGRVFQERNDHESALKAYLTATAYEDKISDNRLKGLIRLNIGMLNFIEPDYKEALANLQKANNFFCRADEPVYQIRALMFMGKSFLLDGDAQNAVQSFEKALDICKTNKSTQYQPEIIQNMAVAFLSTGNYSKANALVRQVNTLFDGEEERLIMSLNLAQLYAETGNLDTARYYARQAVQFLEKAKNTHAMVNAYEVLSAIEEADGEFEQALLYHKQYADSLFKIKDDEYELKMRQIREEYQADLLREQNRTLTRSIWIGVLVIWLLIACAAFFVYRRINRQKNKLRETIEAFEQMKETYNAKDLTIRNLILQHFGIIRKYAKLLPDLKNAGIDKRTLQKINQMVLNKGIMDWDILYKRINQLHNNLINRMKPVFDHNNVNDDDFKIFCLTYSGFRQQEAAIVLNISVSSIQKQMADIRKTFGVEKNEELFECIHQKIAENDVKKT